MLLLGLTLPLILYHHTCTPSLLHTLSPNPKAYRLQIASSLVGKGYDARSAQKANIANTIAWDRRHELKVLGFRVLGF